MIKTILSYIIKHAPTTSVSAHCDGPCGVYDPAQARVAAEAVLSLTKKIVELEHPPKEAKHDHTQYDNTLARYIILKEQEAQNAKDHLLILWTDYFKPEHLETYPDLHDTFWKAAKLCSACKQEVSVEHAEELLTAVKKIHTMFWESKGKDVPWVLANA